MLSDNIQKHLNDQVAAEMYSAYLYLGLACEFYKLGLTGFAHWLKCQFHEEQGHALRVMHYIHERDGTVELADIATAKIDWECPCEAMRAAHEHEKLITGRVNSIMQAARQEADYATENMMQYFVAEQVEEESTIAEIVKKLEMIGEDQNGLIWMDQRLSERPGNPCGKLY